MLSSASSSAPSRSLALKRACSSADSATLLAGAGGVNATTAGAVVMNMTIANPTQVGYLTVFPTGTVRPQVSSINFTQWQDIPNLVTVKLGTGGSVNLYNMNAGQTNLVSDVAGYYIK